ncbi:MAG: HlyD family efflux transporter periplasmic adaptor subunit [Terrisporobacter sp.]
MRKIRYSRLFILGVVIYILFQGIVLLIGAKTSTLEMKDGNYEVKTKVKALVVRDEYLVKSDIDGTLSMLVNENDKVQKSSEVAIIFNNNVDKNLNKKLEELNKEIKKLKEENNVFSTGIISSKEDELRILKKQMKSNTSTFYATTPGVVSFKYDGNEEEYNVDNLENISKEDIDNASNNYINTVKNNKGIKSESVIFRMINNNEIYLAFVSEDNQLSNEGDNVKIKIGKEEINGEIYKNYKKPNSVITIIKFTQQNTGIYDTRVEEFDIIYKQIECLRIPKKSIITRDKKLGTFVINEETKKSDFVEIKGISYEDDDYVYVDFRSNQNKGIDTVDLHDRIILKPNFINKNIKIIN